MAADNSTIYVDVDDEITALIDKVRKSDGRVVALVLPKRATVLQSIVNMKLLKRSADSEKKRLVLVTSESGLMPLAGAVGLHVAGSLTSRPEIPPPPLISPADSEPIDEDSPLTLDDSEGDNLKAKGATSMSVGELAAAANQSIPSKKAPDALDTLELDNEEKPLEPKKDAKAAKTKKDKHLKVPNFDRFRWLLVLIAVALIAIIVLGVLALDVWPHASIYIKTNAGTVNTDLTLNLDSTVHQPDYTAGNLPAQIVQEQKTFTQTVNTTGQKNAGNSATGQVTFVDCSSTLSAIDIPAGTGITYNNLTYITQSSASMLTSVFDSKGNCRATSISSATVNITAQSGGSAYNTPANSTVNFTVPGYQSSELEATGSASGGTDNMVQVVTQADVDTATSKINSNAAAVKQDLINQLQGQNLYPITVTFASASPNVSANPSVGAQGTSVTVTETITYSMFGVSKQYLSTALAQAIDSQISGNQNILSDGLNQNAFKQVSANASTDQVTLSTVAVVGPNIRVADIKRQAAGKSARAIVALIKNNPDVTGVTVRLSPFYVTSAPSSLAKISVTIAKPSKSL